MMFPKENRMANLAGLPVAKLKKDPKDRSWMIYPVWWHTYQLQHRWRIPSASRWRWDLESKSRCRWSPQWGSCEYSWWWTNYKKMRSDLKPNVLNSAKHPTKKSKSRESLQQNIRNIPAREKRYSNALACTAFIYEKSWDARVIWGVFRQAWSGCPDCQSDNDSRYPVDNHIYQRDTGLHWEKTTWRVCYFVLVRRGAFLYLEDFSVLEHDGRQRWFHLADLEDFFWKRGEVPLRSA